MVGKKSHLVVVKELQTVVINIASCLKGVSRFGSCAHYEVSQFNLNMNQSEASR